MMKIEVNDQHKQIDLSKLNLNRAQIKAATFGLSAMLTFFSGALPVKAASIEEQNNIISEIEINYENLDENTIIEIPEIYKEKISYECGKEENQNITVGDLKNIEGILYLNISDNSSLKWLNYCDKVTNLMINLQVDNTDMFKDIELLKNVESFYIAGSENNKFAVAFEKEDFDFIEKCPNLTSLSIHKMDIPKDSIENMTTLETLSISGLIKNNRKIDYNKLTFLKELSFSYDGPYDIAIDFNTEEYTTLVNAGVKVTSAKEGYIDKVCEINQKLDNIVRSLNVDINSTDQEKLDAILIYVLENLTYDKAVSDAIIQNTDHSDLTSSFYQGGELYGALEKNSAICGNYAALVSALADRIDLDSYFLRSDNHGWNMVRVEGEYYYVDATWLEHSIQNVQKREDTKDEQGRLISTEYIFESVLPADMIKKGDTENLNWYMENPNDIDEIEQNNNHDVINMPSFIELEKYIPIVENTETSPTEDKVADITNEKFKVKFGTKTFVICGGTLVGILAGVGVAVNAKKKSERKRRYRNLNDNYYDNINLYDSDYSSYKSRRK